MTSFRDVYSSRSQLSSKTFLDFTPLSASQRQHLTAVYGVLAASVMATGLGLAFNRSIFAVPLVIAIIGQIGCSLYIGGTSIGTSQGLKGECDMRRLAALGLLSFLMGHSLSSIVNYATFVDPSLLTTAGLATLVSFASLSIAATFARERRFLYLGSILSTLLLYLSAASLFNVFFRSVILHDTVVCLGLLGYLAFVIYDTQLILHEHSKGRRDVVIHALLFYGDMIAIFVRLLTMMLERRRRQEDEERRRK